MSDSSHETEDLIQTRRAENGKSAMCTYHYAWISLQQMVVNVIAVMAVVAIVVFLADRDYCIETIALWASIRGHHRFWASYREYRNVTIESWASNHGHCIVTIVSWPSHHEHCIVTIASWPSHCEHRIMTIALRTSHCGHHIHTVTIASWPLHVIIASLVVVVVEELIKRSKISLGIVNVSSRLQ